MATSSSVVIKQTFVVTPAQPTPTCVLELSALDSQPFLRFICDYLLIYRPPSCLDPSAISSTFRAALSEVLTSYYPLSGRVNERLDGSGLEVVCRSQGVLFVEAVSDSYSATNFDKPARFDGEWKQFLVEDVLDGPLLVVQLTWLKDGAVAVGVGLSHSICDGMGSAEFLNSFAELTARRLGRTAESKQMPVWDRHLLSAQPHVLNRRNVPLPQEFQRVADLCGFTSRFTDEPLVPTATLFEKTHLASLKRLGNEIEFTSFEILSAHIWQSWAKCLTFPPNQTLKLLFSINVRKIVNPNLPAGYYGNAVVFGCAQATASELEENSLAYVASVVNRAKQGVGDEHVRHVIELVSKSRASPDFVGVLIITQWSRLGLQKIDFGFGQPIHVGPTSSSQHCCLLPVYNQPSAVKAILAVPTSVVHEYESLVKIVDK